VERHRKLGPVLATIVVAGNMIGSGIFMLPATLATVGGVTVIGWVIASLVLWRWRCCSRGWHDANRWPAVRPVMRTTPSAPSSACRPACGTGRPA
jgi:hypothetical protein